MELVVRGRNVEVPDHFRMHVAEKFARVERYDARIIRTDVELLHEKNPRQSDICQRVEITCRVRGPVVRAEACAQDFYAALDAAMDKIERRFRQSADRRRVHHGRHTPTSVGAATAGLSNAVITEPDASITEPDASPPDSTLLTTSAPDDGPGRIVREKVHPATPMSIEQALHEMELVGHDFYLFHDSAQDRPSVVYRRRGYDYGVIRLGD
ncbi:MAG: ribosome-associated translation inhibitor RaiA [Actinomycetota bacterium]|nr:ribosome-associated translation inhibitor RaiA [Actinomycetota bacterium]